MALNLVTARNNLGRELGKYGRFTATAGSTTTLTCAAAFQSSVLPTDAGAYAWVFVPGTTAPRQRRITATGLNGATGVLTLDAALGAAVGNGTVFEISRSLPPSHESSAGVGNAEGASLLYCLNRALSHLLVDQRDYAVTLVSEQNDYALPAWLNRADRLLDVLEPTATGATRRTTWRHWELRPDAGANQLHFEEPYRFGSGSHTIHLVVKRPADGFMNDSETSGGFSAEGDSVSVEWNQLRPGALAYAYAALREQRSGAARARMDGLYERFVREFRRVYNYDRANDIDPSVSDEPVPAQEAA